MKKTRLDFLDSLRGIAALYVLVFHLSLVPAFKPVVPTWARELVSFGGNGVTLFFVISAFSLCLTMPRHLVHPEPLKSFYLSRFFRIAPLFYAMMVITYIWHGLTFGVWHPVSMIILSASMLYNLVPGYQEGYVWASWTIGVEMLFYLVFPLIYLNARREARLFVLLALSIAIGLSLPSADPKFELHSILRHFPIFVAGMLAFSLYERTRDAGKALGASMLTAGMIGMSFLIWRGGQHYYWQALFLPLIIVGLSLFPVAFVVNRAFSFAGRISYSIYLVHAPVIWTMSPAYRSIYGSVSTNSIAFAACLVATLLVVVPLSWFLYETVERTGEGLGKKLLNRLRLDFLDHPRSPGSTSKIAPFIET